MSWVGENVEKVSPISTRRMCTGTVSLHDLSFKGFSTFFHCTHTCTFAIKNFFSQSNTELCIIGGTCVECVDEGKSAGLFQWKA